MKNKKETYLMKLAIVLFILASLSVVTFGILLCLKISIKISIMFGIAAFMFCVWASILIMIDKKADKLNKNNIMAKPEEVQQEILEKLDDIIEIKKEAQKISYCAHCGTKINENDKICSQCGSNIQNKK